MVDFEVQDLERFPSLVNLPRYITSGFMSPVWSKDWETHERHQVYSLRHREESELEWVDQVKLEREYEGERTSDVMRKDEDGSEEMEIDEWRKIFLPYSQR